MIPRILAASLLALAACTSPSRTHKADTLLDQGDYDAAMARYAEALEADPEDPAIARKLDTVRRMLWRVHREKAAQALERGDLDLAREELARVLELEPKDAEARARLGEVDAERSRILDAVGRARTRLAAGDAEGARAALEPHLAKLAVAPEAVPLLREIDGSRRRSALADGAAALGRQDFVAARDAGRRAAAVLPRSPEAEALLAKAEAGLEAVALAAEAERARTAGDYRSALTLARRALARRPGVTVAEAALSAARRDGARINVEAAAHALGAGRPTEALERLEVAASLDPAAGSPGALAAEVRTRLAADLVARGDEHEAAGRPAAALLHYVRALDLDPGHDGLDARVGAARVAVDDALRVRVRVDDLRNATRVPLDALGMTRSAVARLRAEGLLPWIRLLPDGEDSGEPDVALSGDVTTFTTRVSAPATRTRTVRYVRSVTHEPNPAHAEALRRLRDAEAVLREAESRLEDERRKLAILVENPWDTTNNRLYRRNPDQVRSAYETALLISRTRIRDAERAVNRARDQAVRLRDALDLVPPTVAREEHDTFRRTETTRIASGRAVATIRVTGIADGRELEREEAYGGFSSEDTEAPGYEPAGLDPDPVEIPGDDEMKDLLTEALVANLVARMRDALESLALRDLPGRDADAADPAVQERWARFLLSGVRGDGTTRHDVATRLREATGLIVPDLPGTIHGEDR